MAAPLAPREFASTHYDDANDDDDDDVEVDEDAIAGGRESGFAAGTSAMGSVTAGSIAFQLRRHLELAASAHASVRYEPVTDSDDQSAVSGGRDRDDDEDDDETYSEDFDDHEGNAAAGERGTPPVAPRQIDPHQPRDAPPFRHMMEGSDGGADAPGMAGAEGTRRTSDDQDDINDSLDDEDIDASADRGPSSPRVAPTDGQDAPPPLPTGDQYDDDYEPTEAEMLDYCEWLGVDPVADKPLMWIVREALKAPLPEYWRLCYTEDRELYYFNVQTGESIWDHPMDAFYKALYKQEKAKLVKKRQCMRYYSGSLDIVPLQTFFSELADEEGIDDDDDDVRVMSPRPGLLPMKRQAPWSHIPEALIDAIDFRIYVDPIVLPTSGRTVSRHTIINNRWKDPFTREFVENRRLVSNVDKRSEVDAWLATAVKYFFDSLEVSPAGLQRCLRIVPYLLDKEEEMCLRGQQRLFEFLKKSAAPAPNATTAVPSALGVKDATVGRGASQRPAGTANRNNAATVERAGPAGRKDMIASKSSKHVKEPPQPIAPAPAPARVIEFLKELPMSQSGPFFAALLTMSTSTSRECLLFILEAAPDLARHPAFLGFSEDVLQVLQLAVPDLARMAQTIATHVAKGITADTVASSSFAPPSNAGDSWAGHAWSAAESVINPRRHMGCNIGLAPGMSESNDTVQAFSQDVPAAMRSSNLGTRHSMLNIDFTSTNSEVVATLRWLSGLTKLLGSNSTVRPLAKIDFIALMYLVFTMAATSGVGASPDTLYHLLSSNKDWPQRLSTIPDDVIAGLYKLSASIQSSGLRVRMLFDVVWHGGERAMDSLKAADIHSALVAALGEDDAADVELVRVKDDVAAIAVYHAIISIEDLAAAMTLRVAYNLLPRLTRSQWKPKHFDSTVSRIIDMVQTNPQIAWRALKTTGALFLVRELGKKKRTADESKARLGQLEAAEHRRTQTNAINNWGILATHMLLRVLEETQHSIGLHSARGKLNGDAPSHASQAQQQQQPPPRLKLPAVPGAQPRPSPRETNHPKRVAVNHAPTQQSTIGASHVPHDAAPSRTATRISKSIADLAESLKRLLAKRDDVYAERAVGVASALQTLLTMRLKPKLAPARSLGSVKLGTAAGSQDEVSGVGGDQQVPMPPSGSLSHRRGSGSIVGSGLAPRRDPAVASSCPTLPPIGSAAVESR